jgi:hypothetical protein
MIKVQCGMHEHPHCNELAERLKNIAGMRGLHYLDETVHAELQAHAEAFLICGKQIHHQLQTVTDAAKVILRKKDVFYGPYKIKTEGTDQQVWLHARYPFSLRLKNNEKIYTIGLLQHHPVFELRNSVSIRETAKDLYKKDSEAVLAEINPSVDCALIELQKEQFLKKRSARTRGQITAAHAEIAYFEDFVRELVKATQGKTGAQIKKFFKQHPLFFQPNESVVQNIWVFALEPFAVTVSNKGIIKISYFTEHPYISKKRLENEIKTILKDEKNECFKYAENGDGSFIVPARMTQDYVPWWKGQKVVPPMLGSAHFKLVETKKEKHIPFVVLSDTSKSETSPNLPCQA